MRIVLCHFLRIFMSNGWDKRDDVVRRRSGLSNCSKFKSHHACIAHAFLPVYFSPRITIIKEVRKKRADILRDNWAVILTFGHKSRLLSFEQPANAFSTSYSHLPVHLFTCLRGNLRASHVDLGILSSSSSVNWICNYGELGRCSFCYDCLSYFVG